MEYMDKEEIQEIIESSDRIKETLEEEYGFKHYEIEGVSHPNVYTTYKGEGEETPNLCTVFFYGFEISIWLDEKGTIIDNCFKNLVIGDTVIPKTEILMVTFDHVYLV